MEERTEDKNEVGRWLAVHEVQRKELKKMTVADKFSQLDSLMISGQWLGFKKQSFSKEREVHRKWLKLYRLKTP